ncbi:MAG: EAL domain-containing protein [Nitrospirota bacterium]|nr:EAL domain-containing protein [Nitrospirota bacterium]
MKKKIIISLFALFMLFTIGSVTAVFYMEDNTVELERVIKLHEVEQLRRSLVIDIQAVQSSLFPANSVFVRNLDPVVNNVMKLEETSGKCFSCHHPPELKKRLENIQSLIKDYETALSGSITLSANSGRMEKYRDDAAAVGDRLLALTENMSHDASGSLKLLTDSTAARVTRVKTVLFMTITVTFLLAVVVAVYLTRSVTRPVRELVNATRMIASGNLGATISYKDNTEFGELAGHFNTMSTVIMDGYEKIREEITGRWHAEEELNRSEDFLETVLESIRDPFCVIDSEYRIVRVNKAYAELRNKSVWDLTGKRCYEALKNENTVCRDCIVRTTFQSADPSAKDKKITMKDGAEVWLEIYTYPVFDDDKRVSHVIEYIRDITDRKIAGDALRESEERYVLAARGANDGLWDWDLKNNVIYFSPRWKSILGCQDSEISNSPDEWFNLVHPDDRSKLETEISAHINGQTPHFENEHRILHRDGSYRWVLSRGLAVRNGSPRACRMAGSMTEITERKRAQEQLMFNALHDSLTGLPNRALFMDRLSHLVDREKRNIRYLFAVVFLDVDRFKELNDTLGHMTGDKLLIAIGQRLEESLRPGDTVARLGGDEFAVLLEDLKNRNEALIIVERMRNKLAMPFYLDGKHVAASASIGITFNSTGYDQPEQFLRDADIAMYNAKAGGNGRYEIFDTSMYANAVARSQLETDLRQAVRQNEFLLHYQPVVCVKTGRITGLEALVRWQHPVRGLVYPDEFISIAEETGLIVPLGEWAVYEACRQLRIWQKELAADPPLTVSVNISSRQLLSNIVNLIKDVQQTTGIEPGTLVLEISESILMGNAGSLTPLLQKLKDLGVRLHIDDFGTGYSSMKYLHHLPVDILKIDCSFVSRLGFNEDNISIVRAIAALAHSLNMEVIAEGVETGEELAVLRSLGCDYMQGYYFSRPLDSDKLEALLRQSGFDMIAFLARKN